MVSGTSNINPKDTTLLISRLPTDTNTSSKHISDLVTDSPANKLAAEGLRRMEVESDYEEIIAAEADSRADKEIKHYSKLKRPGAGMYLGSETGRQLKGTFTAEEIVLSRESSIESSPARQLSSGKRGRGKCPNCDISLVFIQVY
ncbi:unnamed protein product [Protopolystoma xenopodis]|uniref:Uncharacterized protein n=1 Tax=Protopolystoma xenopodis TaxID=117903 RepID=A0A448WSL1_9PLAT|nr:unnamed protein product [Protopolystoma xenopodis]